MRHEAGLPLTGFEVGLPLAEAVTQAAVDALQELGVEDLVVIAPWLPSPWDVKAWLEPGDDPVAAFDQEVGARALRRGGAAPRALK